MIFALFALAIAAVFFASSLILLNYGRDLGLRFALARGDGRHPRLLRNLGRADLLILDDWGLEPLDAAARHDLLEILEIGRAHV